MSYPFYYNGTNKYSAKKTPCSQGHMHDSKKEAERCDELHFLLKAKKIHSLEVQKAFLLLDKAAYGKPMKNERKVDYVADFYYFDTELDKWVIEDSKGHRTKDYILKRKLVKIKYCCDGKTVFIET